MCVFLALQIGNFIVFTPYFFLPVIKGTDCDIAKSVHSGPLSVRVVVIQEGGTGHVCEANLISRTLRRMLCFNSLC